MELVYFERNSKIGPKIGKLISFCNIFLFFKSNIIQIKWENCFKKDIGNWALVCVDGVHFKCTEPKLFDRKWKSHKLGGAGLAYELVTCIMTGDIVAYNGPSPAGSWPDINIFRNKTKQKLLPGEKALGDLENRGDTTVKKKLD